MDVDNTPLPGFALTGWSTGSQDFHVEKLAAHGMHAKMAPELEFYTFQDCYRQAAAQGYRDLHPTGHYIEDYHIL